MHYFRECKAEGKKRLKMSRLGVKLQWGFCCLLASHIGTTMNNGFTNAFVVVHHHPAITSSQLSLTSLHAKKKSRSNTFQGFGGSSESPDTTTTAASSSMTSTQTPQTQLPLVSESSTVTPSAVSRFGGNESVEERNKEIEGEEKKILLIGVRKVIMISCV